MAAEQAARAEAALERDGAAHVREALTRVQASLQAAEERHDEEIGRLRSQLESYERENYDPTPQRPGKATPDTKGLVEGTSSWTPIAAASLAMMKEATGDASTATMTGSPSTFDASTLPESETEIGADTSSSPMADLTCAS